MPDKNEVELAYDDAMEASNELGYAFMTAGDVIRQQADEIVTLRAELTKARRMVVTMYGGDIIPGFVDEVEEFIGVKPC
jgi:hypothetical protein